MTLAKAIFYLIELLTVYAAVYYTNFIFFYTKDRFGFGDFENLLLAALNGGITLIAAWQGGRFAQRFGAVRSLYVGFSVLTVALLTGLGMASAPGHVLAFGLFSAGVCFIWPALEAIVSDDSGGKLPDMVGFYNITWASAGALGYFTAGLLLERLGMQSLLWFPLLFVLAQFVLTPIAVRLKQRTAAARPSADGGIEESPPALGRQFLHMAWLANPLSYVAINTILPLIPSIAEKLGLSTGQAGILCSVWFFARLGAFILLWRWKGWHYRFSYLAASFGVMIAGFVGMILAPSILVLLVAQLGFGLAIGLIYYSSLYYAMHASEQKSSNGGLHEAMIGAGLMVGPACSASAVLLLPAISSAGTWSVGGLLVIGFSGLLWMRRRKPATADSRAPA